MPLEVVNNINDLNAAWPLDGDQKQFGDDHIRNIKVALKTLLTGVEQLGFTTLEILLAAPTTNITFTPTVQRGAQVVAILTQDGVGGRQVTWDAAKFDFGPTDINLDPNGVTAVAFVGRSNAKLFCYSVRMHA